MNIVEREVDKLIPYSRNAKKHDETQISNVAESIKQFGFVQPVVVDKNGVIVIGHCRTLAAKKLGMKTVPCVMVDDLTDEQVKALRIIDNKTNESPWDMEMLAEELADIDLSGFDFDFEIDLPEESKEDEDKEIVEDEAPEVDEDAEPIAKLGDIWQLGRHRLMCGDSTDKAAVELLMDGKKADMVFTDPPYGMRLDTDYSEIKGSKNAKIKGKGGNKYRPVIGDGEDFKPSLIETVFENFAYCEEIFLFGADYFAELIVNKNDGSWVVWDKRGSEDADKIIGSCFELCWSKQKHKREIARIKWMGAFGSADARNRVHPTQKPIKLCEWFIEKYSNASEAIIDLYGGSGSTLIACEQLDRICYMMELDPKYCDVIIKRWESLTGEKAVKL